MDAMGIASTQFSTGNIDASSIADGLGLRRVGRQWRGPCPVHGGSSFTLADKGGTPVWTCWQGCDRKAILAELRSRGLWPERERQTFSLEERRRYSRARQEAAALAQTAADWYKARLAALSDEKRAAIDYDGGRFNEADLASAAHEEYRLRSLTPEGILAEWKRARQADPIACHRLERIGAEWARACHSALRRVVDNWSAA